MSVLYDCPNACSAGACITKNFPGVCGDLTCTTNTAELRVKQSMNVTFGTSVWKVKLDYVSSDRSVQVIVDGVKKIIPLGETESVNNLPVQNEDATYSSNLSQRKSKLNFGENEKTCREDCGTQGPVCGNNIKEDGEQCDGQDLGGVTCTSLGFTGGNLACTSTCVFEVNQCTTTGRNRTYLAYILEKATVELYNQTGKQDIGGWKNPSWNTSAIAVLTLRAVNDEDNAIKLPSTGVVSQCAGKETDQVFIRAARPGVQTYGNNITLYWKDSNDGGKAKFCGSASEIDEKMIGLNLSNGFFYLGGYKGVISSLNNPALTPKVRFILSESLVSSFFFMTNVSSSAGAVGFEDGFSTVFGGGRAIKENIFYVGDGEIYIGDYPQDFYALRHVIYNPKFYGDMNKVKFGLDNSTG